MKHFEVIKTVNYARKLINAGVSGIRDSKDVTTGGRSPAKILAESGFKSLTLAAVATCIGLVTARSQRIPKSLALGTAAFCAGLAWGSASIGWTLATAAGREMRKVRDEHWLQTHPIDYA